MKKLISNQRINSDPNKIIKLMVEIEMQMNLEERIKKHISESKRTQLNKLSQRIAIKWELFQYRLRKIEDEAERLDETLTTIRQQQPKMNNNIKQLKSK